jgi:hypothetical protein
MRLLAGRPTQIRICLLPVPRLESVNSVALLGFRPTNAIRASGIVVEHKDLTQLYR